MYQKNENMVCLIVLLIWVDKFKKNIGKGVLHANALGNKQKSLTIYNKHDIILTVIEKCVNNTFP